MDSIPGWGRSPRKGNSNPVFLPGTFQGNPMDRGAWQATVLEVTEESDTTERVQTHTHTHTHANEKVTYTSQHSVKWSALRWSWELGGKKWLKIKTFYTSVRNSVSPQTVRLSVLPLNFLSHYSQGLAVQKWGSWCYKKKQEKQENCSEISPHTGQNGHHQNVYKK